ncbi:ATP-dependent RNA helicase [Chloropicon primus]|nr:ATP-dependent RNA helicase [Chloropicon primus]
MAEDRSRKRAKVGEVEAASGDVVTLVESVDGKTCTHQCVWPEGARPTRQGPPPSIPSHKAAKEYEFKLDPFQYTSMNCMEQGESVMVAAHTSAGKTVVAEYAIAMALRDGQRVVYTSPLKALSNQKYRELSEKFSDVGLMTGDVTINENASCLVMTTEILRSMLYRGSEVAIEVAWIIFDEIHYLRDKERGVVWEETIILVPDTVHFVFLSATLPNAKEFAGWIAKIHKQPCHLVSTDYRPTPLQHFMFPAGASGLYMVVDEKSKFKPDNFQKAVATLSSTQREGELLRKEKHKRNQEDILKIVQLIMERRFDPCIIFAFSKKDCENLATKLTNLDLTTDDEKKLIGTIFENAVDCLSEEDKRLPQIRHLLPLLRQGIGIHHSGLLPILKEVVEVLFQEGLLKCLFATETFSTGLNMPAKTVVFVRPRKFDGGGFRWLSSGEYIQMSGRAGRRGLDDKGIVILMLDSKMEPAVARQMVQGSADPLVSAFHLSFNMILNLCRTDGGDPSALMRSSYRQHQTELALPALKKRAKELEERCKSVQIENEDEVEKDFEVLQKVGQLRAQRRQLFQDPSIALPFLQPGRLVKVLSEDALDMDRYLAAKEHAGADDDDEIERESKYVAETMIKASSGEGVLGCVVGCKRNGSRGYKLDALLLPEGDAEPKVTTVDLSRIESVSKVRIYLPKEGLKSLHARKKVLTTLREVEKRFNSVLPLLDPKGDMKLQGEMLDNLLSAEQALESEGARDWGELEGGIRLLCKKTLLKRLAELAKREEKLSRELVGHEELKARKKVLRKLHYLDSVGRVSSKGHLAAEISSADELVLTEMLVNGVFKNLPCPETISLLSCFVSSGNSKYNGKLSEEYDKLFKQLREQVSRVAKLANEASLGGIDMDKYLDAFSPQLMEATAAWARGSNFSTCLKLGGGAFEGSLVRAIRRIEELLQQLIKACQVVGEHDQAEHFSECSDKIKRDVVFAASLYL